MYNKAIISSCCPSTSIVGSNCLSSGNNIGPILTPSQYVFIIPERPIPPVNDNISQPSESFGSIYSPDIILPCACIYNVIDFTLSVSLFLFLNVTVSISASFVSILNTYI